MGIANQMKKQSQLKLKMCRMLIGHLTHLAKELEDFFSNLKNPSKEDKKLLSNQLDIPNCARSYSSLDGLVSLRTDKKPRLTNRICCTEANSNYQTVK